MTTARCPKCGHATFSKKWGTCTADGCSLNHSYQWTDTYMTPSGPKAVSMTVTKYDQRVTKIVMPSDEKPVTPKRGPKATYASPAERQRAYRARKKAVA